MRFRVFLLSAASAAGFALAAVSAAAQDSGYGQPQAYPAPNEEVVITAPRAYIERGPLNGPVEKVSLSVPVRFDDLDLRTAWGAHALRSRVRAAAADICSRLNYYYPAAISGDPPCYRQAVFDAMPRAEEAITAARQYSYYSGY
jgi:UrcA family protein